MVPREKNVWYEQFLQKCYSYQNVYEINENIFKCKNSRTVAFVKRNDKIIQHLVFCVGNLFSALSAQEYYRSKKEYLARMGIKLKTSYIVRLCVTPQPFSPLWIFATLWIFCKFAILCSIILCTRKHCCQFLNVGSIVANCYMAHAFKRALLSLANSPGLVVIGGDLCSEGHEFESQHCIMDGHFSHLFVCFKRWK